jgi:hypothetical protein
MKAIRCATSVAVLLAVSAASLQTAAAWQTRHSKEAAQWGWNDDQSQPARRLHQSGNSCAPDRAESVWSSTNQLLGYSCEPASANGS